MSICGQLSFDDHLKVSALFENGLKAFTTTSLLHHTLETVENTFLQVIFNATKKDLACPIFRDFNLLSMN